MNDDRPIEKLLRRYAKKRRDEAGAPLELHPATRRMLQGEVARQFPRRAAASDGEPTTFATILIGWRTRWIWAIPILIVLGVGVWALVGTKDEPGHTYDLAMKTPAPAATAELVDRSFKALEKPESALPAPAVSLADQPKVAYAPDSLARDKRESSGVSATSAGGRLGVTLDGAAADRIRKEGDATTVNGLAALRENEPALKPETEPVRANEFTQVAAMDAPRSQFTVTSRAPFEETRALSDEKIPATGLAFSPPARSDSPKVGEDIRRAPMSASGGRLANVPASKAAESAPDATARRYGSPARVGAERERTLIYSQAFANQAPAFSYARAIAKSGPVTPVLANFQIEQTGNQLRVVDGDGSTYLGEMQLPAATSTAIVAFQKKGASELKSKAGDQASKRQVARAALPGQKDAPSLFACRVEGTNRTLKQQVVFTWNFVPLSNVTVAAQVKAPSGEVSLLQNNAPVQPLSLLNNSVVNGRAQLGGAKEIEINAVPVTR